MLIGVGYVFGLKGKLSFWSVAFVRDAQALHRLAANQVRFDDLINIPQRHAAIPDVVGIDDDCRAVLAGIQAAGGVGAHCSVKPAFFQCLLELGPNFLPSAILARPSRVVRRAFVGADEDMF